MQADDNAPAREATGCLLPILPPWEFEVPSPSSSSFYLNGNAGVVDTMAISEVYVYAFADQSANDEEDELYNFWYSHDDPMLVIPNYRDWSCVIHPDQARASTFPMMIQAIRTGAPFPIMLHHILSDKVQCDDCILWLPHGRAFSIIDVEKFCEEVALPYFGFRDFNAFTEALDAYSFRRIYYKYETQKVTFFHEVRYSYMHAPFLSNARYCSHSGL